MANWIDRRVNNAKTGWNPALLGACRTKPCTKAIRRRSPPMQNPRTFQLHPHLRSIGEGSLCRVDAHHSQVCRMQVKSYSTRRKTYGKLLRSCLFQERQNRKDRLLQQRALLRKGYRPDVRPLYENSHFRLLQALKI